MIRMRADRCRRESDQDILIYTDTISKIPPILLTAGCLKSAFPLTHIISQSAYYYHSMIASSGTEREHVSRSSMMIGLPNDGGGPA